MTMSQGQEASKRSGPLDGVRVLDLTRILAGPYCTMQLGDLGADVVKVEPPGGDDSRTWGPPFANGESAYYLGVNRNKRGLRLDLRTPEGQDAIRRLARTSDVVVENFMVGSMERWGLGYEDCLAVVNPRLIYCSITGYGRTGPSSHLPGYDPVIEAVSGLMSVTGQADGPPTKFGVALVDIITGHQAALGISAALRARDLTGEGQRVDVSLFETALSVLANQASSYLLTGTVPRRHGNGHPAIVPFEVFATSDGSVMVCAGNDRQFRKLCELFEVPELATDVRFATNPARVTNRAVLTPLLERHFALYATDDLVGAAERAGVPIGPVNTLDTVFEHPQVAAREMLIAMEHPAVGMVQQVGFPIKFGRTPASLQYPPPLLGEHTEEVLREAGFSSDEIGTLLAEVGP
jgi:crotonobetainyl-CoA:carnitine CoA-transferase CaiB-like acyl-CoA transferase